MINFHFLQLIFCFS